MQLKHHYYHIINLKKDESAQNSHFNNEKPLRFEKMHKKHP